MKLSISLLTLAVATLGTTTAAFSVSRPTGAAVTGKRQAVVRSTGFLQRPQSSLAMSTATEEDNATQSAAPVVSGDAGSVDVASGARQMMYGQSLDLPDTYVRCGRCKTAFALQSDDLGSQGKGRRVECSVCSHSWYQARDRLFDLSDNFELVPTPSHDLERISKNIEAGRDPDYVGDSKFYVGNLDFRCTEDDLREVFAEKGNVGDVSIVTDQETGRSRGFAFVTMMTREDGEKAMELDGEEVNGRNISVRPPNN